MDIFNCTYETLKYDEACVNLRAQYEDLNPWLYVLSSECIGCPYERFMSIPAGTRSSIKINTVRPLKLRIIDSSIPEQYVSARNTSNVICDLSPNLGQYGVYELSLQNQSCDMKTLRESTYPFTELFVICGALILFLLMLSGLKSLWHYMQKRCIQTPADETTNKVPTKRRIRAIDTFRGASTLTMIFSNDGSGGYAILGHSTWNGMLLGDLVFPCFMWIMGVCIPMSISGQLKRLIPKHAIALSIIKRSTMLFLIGISLNTVVLSVQVEKLRIFGVLQRFGVTYLVAALTFLFLMPQKQRKWQSPFAREIQDIVRMFPQWCVMLVILAVHCILTFCLKVPNCPTGYLGPGGWHEDGKYFDCAGGSTGYIDKVVLTEKHMYQKPTIDSVYKSGAFDPEGILGCLTSIFQVFIGVHTGVVMMLYKDWKDRVIRWLAWAAIYACIGSALHFGNVIPVNKNLWSLSFVLVTSSFALALLSALYLLIDIAEIWHGGPFRLAGMNALLLYVGHILCYKLFPFHWRIGDMNNRALSFFESVWGVGLWTLIAYMMHWKRQYISL